MSKRQKAKRLTQADLDRAVEEIVSTFSLVLVGMAEALDHPVSTFSLAAPVRAQVTTKRRFDA